MKENKKSSHKRQNERSLKIEIKTWSEIENDNQEDGKKSNTNGALYKLEDKEEKQEKHNMWKKEDKTKRKGQNEPKKYHQKDDD